MEGVDQLKKHLIAHTRKELTTAQKLSCNICDYKAFAVDDIFRHKTNQHLLNTVEVKIRNNDVNFSCDLCEFSFDTLTGLEIHTKSSHKQMMYKCDMCDFQDNSLPTISQHEKKNHLEQINTTEKPNTDCNLKVKETEIIALKNKTLASDQGHETAFNNQPRNLSYLKTKERSQFERKTLPKFKDISNKNIQQKNICDLESIPGLKHVFKTHNQDKLYVKSKDMSKGGLITEDNPIFSISNSLQPKEDTINNDLYLREDFESYKLRESQTIDDHNSDGNVSEAKTYQGPDGENEINSDIGAMFEFEKLSKQDLMGIAIRNLKPHDRHTIKCDVCRKSFGRRSTLLNHMERAHGSVQYSCDYCAYSGSSKQNLKDHLQKRHHKFMYNCNNCDFQSNSLKYISVHENTMHEKAFQLFDSIKDVKFSKVKDDDNKEKQYHCRRCKATFVSEKILQKHSYRDHKHQKCSLCDRSFASIADLKLHIMGKHTGQRPFPCPTCDKAYICNTSRKKHIENFHSNKKQQEPITKPYPCSGCRKVFFTVYGLTRHKKSHKKENQYECSVCGKKFSVQSNRVKHKCNICTKAFFHQYKLKCHLRTHTGEKPFKCGTCDKVYGESSLLKRHKRSHMKESDRKFSCSRCDKKFLHSHHLKNHSMTHTGIRPFNCNTCHLTFRRPDSLQNHKYRLHGIKQTFNFDNLIEEIPMVFVGSEVFTT